MAKKVKPRGPVSRRSWVRWSDENLMDLRLCDLGLKLEGTWIEACVRKLHRELEARGLNVRPHTWLSQEFFSPGGVPGIAIPFYLAHPRLMKLERRKMLEVEGGTRDELMRILRHEAGHALQHAFQFQRRRSWQAHFGLSSKAYPEQYRPNPASRRYVQHLRLYYAQAHPDEDFAETFAVWLQPKSAWRRRYAGWPAFKKLVYVDDLMKDLAGQKPRIRTRRRVDSLRTLRTTLGEHYAQKAEHYLLSYPNIYDRELRRLFSDDPRHRSNEWASHFLRRNRTEIRRLVSRWTGEHQFTLDHVMTEMIGRCRELKLRAVGADRTLRMDFAVLLTVKVMHYLYSERSWIAV